MGKRAKPMTKDEIDSVRTLCGVKVRWWTSREEVERLIRTVDRLALEVSAARVLEVHPESPVLQAQLVKVRSANDEMELIEMHKDELRHA